MRLPNMLLLEVEPDGLIVNEWETSNVQASHNQGSGYVWIDDPNPKAKTLRPMYIQHGNLAIVQPYYFGKRSENRSTFRVKKPK